jgi:hypothetical protein
VLSVEVCLITESTTAIIGRVGRRPDRLSRTVAYTTAFDARLPMLAPDLAAKQPIGTNDLPPLLIGREREISP